MLAFLRKHQGIVLTIVGGSLLLPFSFFGTYRAFRSVDRPEEVVLGHAINGSKIIRSDVHQIAQLLGAEQGQDTLFGELLQSGVLDLLSESYLQHLQKEWQNRYERAKRFRFYVHPANPVLNARSLWGQFAPGLLDEVNALQASTELPSDFFARWKKIYLLQERCPAELIRRILLYQQNQMGNIPQDPRLLSEEFSLFGYRSSFDWFGRDLFYLVAQLVINGSVKGSEQGFSVSDAEVEADLVQRFTSKETNIQHVLRSLGIGYQDAIRIWKKMLLFMRILNDAGQAILIDDLSIQKVLEFANETVTLDLYTLPEELQFHSVDDFLAYKVYTEQACSPVNDPSFPPLTFLAVQEIEKKAPELLFNRYRICYHEIDRKKIASRIPMTLLWEWQIEHWSELQKKFPKLPESQRDARFQILEKQEAKQRSSIDDWSRDQIVQAHPEWIDQEFCSSLLQEREITISADYKRIDSLPIEKIESFAQLLEQMIQKGDSQVEFFDKEFSLRISAVEKKADRALLSLAEAKKKGVLKTEAYLQKMYEKVREKDPLFFKDEKGAWKSLASVKEEVVLRSFKQPFYRTFERAILQMIPSIQQEGKLDFGLWKLCQNEKVLSRKNFQTAVPIDPFLFSAGQWSSLLVPEHGGLSLFLVKQKGIDEENVKAQLYEQMKLAKQELVAEIQCNFVSQLLVEIEKKQAINLQAHVQESL